MPPTPAAAPTRDTSPSHVVADQSDVIAFLADPASHGLAGPVKRIDTHGAVVFLAGAHAYKLKRAVRFPFMDFSTVEKRRAACEAEIAINRPNAPSIYLDAVAVTRRDGGLHLGGAGTAVDWVVRMRRFDESLTLDRVAEAGGLTPSLLRSLTRAVLASHERAPLRDGDAATAALGAYLDQNQEAFAESPAIFAADRAARLTAGSRAILAACRERLHERGRQGFVRRCHGDLHLRNLVLIDGVPTLFDAVEFDDGIATCDVLYDLAFLLMDLWQSGLRAEANAVLNRYLWAAGEKRHLSALGALPLFLSIRAALRAKIAAAAAGVGDRAGRPPLIAEARRYFDVALSFLDAAPPRLVAVGGLSGTGKSTLAAALAPALGGAPGAVHLRSDIQRKQMFGVAETDRLPGAAYRPAVSEAVQDRLRHKAELALGAGWSVIVDAVHARPEERAALAELAERCDVPFLGLWLEAPAPVLVERVAARQDDASDADAAVVRRQLDYDLGALGWTRLDASAAPGDVLARARALLDARDHDDHPRR